MQQIVDWLEKLGMSEYAQRFAENGINFQALRHLTDQDLKDIGVLLGHRRIMLAAIGELTGPAVTTPLRAPIPEPKQIDDKSMPPEEQQHRKRALIQGPKEFREIREDLPKSKR
jgi:SAM domain (Sterile alpha motif)